MSRNSPYKHIRTNRPGRSVFDLSYEKKFTCDMGQLIPVMCDEVVPGDYFKIGNQAVVRFQPLVSPVLHEINMYTHYFFVPYRLLWEDWEDFISGGVDGNNADAIPTWTPIVNTVGSFWDYLGFPIGVDPEGARPIDFPRRAYNLVYNEYYRDENLQTEVALTNETILNRAWEKDYFTSSLPWQQRGTAPALPISGSTAALWAAGSFAVGGGAGLTAAGFDNTTNGTNPKEYQGDANSSHNAMDFFNSNTVDLSTASTFDIADLRLAFQIQRWMELNARAGVRYTEFLRAHFGVSPRDERLQRPEYIGGSKSPIIISEVLQTSETAGTPQGTLAGHGITISDAYCGKYRAEEFGLIIGIMSVMPRSAYQQGINKQWLKETKYDFFFPEFANLSEQAIIRAELIAKDNDTAFNQTIFGYQGRYDELRTKQSIVCGELRANETYDYWTLSRVFDPAQPPVLNGDFIECDPALLKSIFAAPAEPGLIVSFGNIVKAVRPLPIIAEPGRIDH